MASPIHQALLLTRPPTVIAPINPSALSGLIGWWDTSVTASLTGAGGGFVSAIADQSGAGNDMIDQTTTTTYSATGFNTSYPALVFDVANRAGYFAASSFPMGTGSTLTTWYVGTFTNSGNAFLSNGRPLSYAKPANNDFDNAGSWAVLRPNLDTAVQVDRNSIISNASVTLTSPHRIIVTINSSGVVTIYVNGVATIGSTAAGNWVSAGTMRLGANGSGPQLGYWNGPIAEWGVATGFTSSDHVAGLDLYLKNKWGL